MTAQRGKHLWKASDEDAALKEAIRLSTEAKEISHRKRSLFISELAELGFKITDVKADGNCFFRAISQLIFGSENHHHEIRESVALFLSSNKAMFNVGEAPFSDGLSYSEHVAELAKDGVYVDNDAVFATAIVYSVNIIIHKPDCDPIIVSGTEEPSAPILQLVHVNDNHYMVAQPGIIDNPKSPTSTSDLCYTIALGCEVHCSIVAEEHSETKQSSSSNAIIQLFQEEPLSEASKTLIGSGRVAIEKWIKSCLKQGANIHAEDVRCLNFTPLHHAARAGYCDFAAALLDIGSNVDEPKHDGCTPLMIASQYGQVDVVDLLISRGANINAVDNKGDTAMIYAVIYCQENAVQLLLSKGVDGVNHKNNNGKSALSYALEGDRPSIVELLQPPKSHKTAPDNGSVNVGITRSASLQPSLHTPCILCRCCIRNRRIADQLSN